MKIYELLSEQTISTTGSTTGVPNPVQQVSQTQPSTSQPNQTASKEKLDPNQTASKEKLDPNQIQLANILKQQGKTNPEDLTKTATALQKTMQNPNNPNLNDEENSLLGSLMGSTLKNPATVTAIKAIAAQRPQSQPNQSTQPNQPGQV